MKIFDLTIDYERSPLGVDEAPLLCWKTDIPQESYAVAVTCGGESVYAGGTVRSGETVGILLPREILRSDERYEVTLTARGTDGSEDTAAARFETGLLSPGDWKGYWVSVPANFTGAALLVRKDLYDLPRKKIARARCFVAGLGYHELYLNGKKVGDSVLSPALSDLKKRVYYVAYDVTDLLNGEKNVLGVMLGNGWLGKKELLLQLNVLFEDGERYEAYTGKDMWWAKGGAIVESSVYGGEVYDARKETDSWACASEEPAWENGWMYLLREVTPPTGRLVHQSIPPIRVCEVLPPVGSRRTADGSVLFDVGKNIAGWCRIRVRGPRGSRVTLYHGEDLAPDGTLNRSNLRLAGNKDVYLLKGEGIEEYAPRFTYHGFRYVFVKAEDGAEIVSLTAEHVHTAVRRCGAFSCSDEVVNRLHEMAALTEANNLHGIMTDCPQRDERFMWLNDLSSRIYQSVNNYGMERVFPKVTDDITDTADELGRIADTAPFYVGKRPADPVSVCYLLFALRSYEWYGDRRPIDRHYGALKAWTDFLIAHSTGYLMNYTYYGDWVLPFPDEENRSDNLLVSSAYLFWHIVCMEKIARIAGREADAAAYGGHRLRAREAFNRRFYRADRKFYDNNTQTANALALSLGLAPEKDRAAIGAHVMADIRRREMHLSCGNQGYRHLFYALSDLGYTDELVRVLVNPAYPGWGYMAACGATTVWERWEREMQCEMHSFDHPMFGSYDGWLYEYLGGIRLAEDAFGANKILIAPKAVPSLSFVESAVETVRGKIFSAWERRDGMCFYRVQIPGGTEAALEIEGLPRQTLGAGAYSFTVRNS